MYLSVRLSACLTVSVLVCLSVAQHDETLTPGAKGAGVVEAVCSRLEASCVFSEDKLLTRRLAYVESYDGNHADTYREGYNGGIWKVDRVMFNLTQTSAVRSYLSKAIQDIRLAFGIDWATVKWEDLRKPLYSALGARLYLQYNARAVTTGIPRSIADQANYWVTYYRPGESKDKYIREADKLEKVCSNTNGADIVFILDESGSVGSANFVKVKSFVKDIVRSFNVGLGSHQNRIAVTTYSTSVVRKFDLNDYTTEADILRAIDNIIYRGGNTATDLALNDLAVSFTAARGARPKEAGHPRVGIVVTDGVSNTPSLTIAAAKKVHDADITVFSVGVGSSLNMNELQTIASNPTCLHLMLLSNFQEFDSLKYIIEKRTCDAPIVIGPDDNSTVVLPPDGGQNCKIRVPNAGTTVKVEVTGGEVFFYVAGSTYPSNDFFEFKVWARPGRLGVIYVTKPRTNDTEGIWFCNIKGDNSSSNVSVGGQPGDHDKCRNKICANGGECVQTREGHAWCDCPPHYTGQNCQTAINYCDSNPCINGQCTSQVGKFKCNCVAGYTGERCQTNINDCLPNRCQNGATCVDKVNGYQCTCPPGFTGANCENEINLCISANPCLNGATCSPVSTGVICTCVPGFIGPNCQININDCSPNPCQNGATCVDKVNGYQCTCPPGFTGVNCENVVTTPAPGGYDCESNNPCKEGIDRFYFPHSDPSKYVQCSEWGQCYVMSCGPGTVWDTTAYTCVAGGGSVTTTTTTTSTTTNSGSGTGVTYNCDTDSPCIPEKTSGGQFYFPHDNPNKFVQCGEWGECYEKSCGYGLVWDPVKYACDFL